jgi:hypothetical protein
MFLFKGPEKIETGVKNVVGYDCGDDDNFRGSVMRTIYFGLIGILNIISILLLAAMYIRIFRAGMFDLSFSSCFAPKQNRSDETGALRMVFRDQKYCY